MYDSEKKYHIWNSIQKLEGKCLALQRQIAAADSRLEELRRQLINELGKMQADLGHRRTPSNLTDSVIAVLQVLMRPAKAREVQAWLGLSNADHQRVYDALRNEAAKKNGRIRNRDGSFEMSSLQGKRRPEE